MGFSVKGFFFLGLTILLFMLNYLIVKLLYVKIGHYDKPFFITYVSIMAYSLLIFKNIFSCKSISLFSYSYELKTGIIFSPLYFLCLYLTNLGVLYTDLSSVTIISGSSMIMIAFLSKFMLDRRITIITIGSLIIAAEGIVILGLNDKDTDNNSHSIRGDIIIFVSLIIYSFYTVLMKKIIPEEENAFDMSIFFFYVSIISAVIFFPLFFILNMLGIEPFALPNMEQFIFIIIDAVLGYTLADYAYANTVLLLSPLIMEISLSLNTPLAMIADKILNQTTFRPLFYCGLVLCFAGFFLIIFDEYFLVKDEIQKKFKLNNNSQIESNSTSEIEGPLIEKNLF